MSRPAPHGGLARRIGPDWIGSALVGTALGPVAFGQTILRPTFGSPTGARRQPAAPRPPALLSAVPFAIPSELRRLVANTAARMAPGPRGGRVYTDDLAPVAWLVDLSLAEDS